MLVLSEMLRKQIQQGFNGRINILGKNSSLLAYFYLENQKVYYSSQQLPLNVIESYYLDENARFIFESEKVQIKELLTIQMDDFLVLEKNFLKIKSLAPPDNIYLKPKKNINLKLNEVENELLFAIDDGIFVNELYNKSKDSFYQTTLGLISLRQKKLLFVTKRNEL